ncbi:MAG TPA: HD domain-containing protein [Candidatus Paceibacterota bacterium]|nr:HD domain-containing protein [Candidatus Paceibacterota bacterium]
MQKPELSPETVRAMIDLGVFAFAFGLTNRVTRHPDGETLESDSDHTVMLGLAACAFAQRFAPHLDIGKIAQFALVHDLVEVYAGDAVTSHTQFTEADHKTKDEREAAALTRIRSEFDAELPWLGETIEAYERRDTPEARFVKVVDKAMPKIANILNKGVTFKPQGHDKESARAFLENQRAKLSSSYGSDQPEALALLEALGEEMMREIFPG